MRHPAARPPCGARPARPLAVRATSFARRVVSKPGQAQQASRHPPVGRLVLPGPATAHRHRSHLPPSGPRAAFRRSSRNPSTPRIPLLWLPRLLLQHSTTAGNTADEIGEHSGSQWDKTLPARHKTLILACFTHAGTVLSRHPGRAWATPRIRDDEPRVSRVTSPMTGRRRWVFLLRMLISYPGAQINDSMQAE